MVGFVVGPERRVDVAEVMPIELEEVTCDPTCKE